MFYKREMLMVILVMATGSLSFAAVEVNFDNFQLAMNSHWGGAGSEQAPLKTKGISLPYSEDQWSWSGFAYSNEMDTMTNSYTNQFSAITGQDVSGKGNYGVGAFSMKWWDDYSIDPLNIPLHPGEKPHGSVVAGAYFTNTTYTYLTMKEGDAWGFSDPFGGVGGDEEDYLKMLIRGIDIAGNYVDSTIEFYLGDYRFADNSQDYLVDEWTWVDLSGLGAIAQLEFILEGSDTGTFGLNTPAYFAMDNLILQRGNGQIETSPDTMSSQLSMSAVALIPEPATVAFLGLGALLLRKRK